jgi:hypothetical protein
MLSPFCNRTFIPGILNPELRGNKQVFSRHTAFFDCLANCFFISISSRSINQTVASAYSIVHASFAFFSITYLKNAKPYRYFVDLG